jgi:hypothetical protein
MLSAVYLAFGVGLTSGHAKGFVGVVEISTRRIASVMRNAAPIGGLGGSIDQPAASSVAIARDVASALCPLQSAGQYRGLANKACVLDLLDKEVCHVSARYEPGAPVARID